MLYHIGIVGIKSRYNNLRLKYYLGIANFIGLSKIKSVYEFLQLLHVFKKYRVVARARILDKLVKQCFFLVKTRNV